MAPRATTNGPSPTAPRPSASTPSSPRRITTAASAIGGAAAIATRPSPITPRPSGSTRTMPTPTTTGASRTTSWASSTRRSPTAPRPFGSIRSTSMPTTSGAMPIRTKGSRTRPSPTSRKPSGSAEVRRGVLQPRQLLPEQARPGQGHRRLHRGHSAPAGVCYGVYQSGAAYHVKGDRDRAIADCTEAIRLDPTCAARTATGAIFTRNWANSTRPSPTARRPSARAEVCRGVQQPRPCLQHATRLREGDSRPRRSDPHRSRVCHRVREPRHFLPGTALRQGAGRLRRGPPARPKRCPGHFNRAILYDGKGDHDKAIADYTETIRRIQNMPAGTTVAALPTIRKASTTRRLPITTRPFASTLALAVQLLNRGHSYREKHQYDKCRPTTRRPCGSLRLADAYYGRGLAYAKKGEKAKADDDFAQAKKLGYKPEPKAEKASALTASWDYSSRSGTRADSRRAARLSPGPCQYGDLRCRNFVSSPFGADIYSDLLPPHGRQRKGNHS